MGYEWNVFISYTRDELVSQWVHEVFYPVLEAHLRICLGNEPRIFIDDRNTRGGEAWPERLKRALGTSKLLIGIWSPWYFKRDWCQKEFKAMFYRESLLDLQTTEDPTGLIIPINVQDGEHFPKEVANRLWYDYQDFLLEGVRQHTPPFIEFQKRMKSFVGNVNHLLRNSIPPWSDSWLESAFFDRAFSEIVLTEPNIVIDKPTLLGFAMGKVVTFYSYKGGVGRSMALANIAVLLARWKYKVLMIDWDLEAPGLENFFKDYASNYSQLLDKGGLVDILISLSATGHFAKREWQSKVVKVDLASPKASIDLLTAGKKKDSYFSNVRQLDIGAFYSESNGGQLIECLRDQWKKEYDFVLIDSRTGVTDIGGICTVQLPDILVLFLTATEQSFTGTLDIAKRVNQEHKRLAISRHRLLCVPVPSRFDTTEEFKLSQQWLDRFSNELSEVYTNWLPTFTKSRELLEITKVPYSTYFSYGEKLPVVEQGTTDPTGLGYAYENIAALIADNAEHVEVLLERRDDLVDMVSSRKRRSASRARVFVSYSHRDEKWKDRVLPHLQALEQQGDIVLWDDRKIATGDDWYPAIKKELDEAAVAICLISADYLSSDFVRKEEFPALKERRSRGGMLLLPILVRPCPWQTIQWLKGIQMLPRDGKSLAEIQGEVNQDKALADIAEYVYEKIKDPTFEGAPPAPKWPPPEKVDIDRLPHTGLELFGRQKELKLLDEAWEWRETKVISLVAWGGVGKSTLVNRWLELMGRDNYRGARRVFGWSFYSQGTKERVTSADTFISEALTWFGDPDPTNGSPWDKGQRLADLIRKEQTLLILDGMEPLQSGLDFEKGKIKDPALSMLVTQLARNNNGLCVITTRESVAELARFDAGVLQPNLDQISKQAGRSLLRIAGVKGSYAELEATSAQFGNHALAINLLGSYLHDIEGHHIQDAAAIPDLDIPENQGKHPRRVIEAFEKRFGKGPEVQLLRILGLFDRPAELQAIKAVYSDDPIAGLTDELVNLTADQWQELFEKLRNYKLLARKSTHAPDIVDCHPIIREHFSETLQKGNAAVWRQAHSRLYEYHKALPEKELPDTLEEMQPLFTAVAHGCQAGLYQKALDDVYWDRISRTEYAYFVKQLAAFGSDLPVLAGFFEEPWTKPTSGLTEHDQASVLNWAGFRLRALGRLREAGQPMQAALDRALNLKDWNNAARQVGNLSELYLRLGEIRAAVDFAERSVEYADRSQDAFQRYSKRTTLADALHQVGDITRAEELFREAEQMQKEDHPEYPYLYSLQGFQFCDLLLSQGRYREVQERASQTLQWVSQAGWLLDIGLDTLSLGRACLLQVQEEGSGDFGRAADYLNHAVEGLRNAGQQDNLPHGLLARAALYRLQGDFERARGDLAEAAEIAERGEMKLHLADYHLESARLCLAEGDKQKTREHLEKAETIVNETGYHRRDGELQEIRRAVEQ